MTEENMEKSEMISHELLWGYQVVPDHIEGNDVYLRISDKMKDSEIQSVSNEIAFITGRNIHLLKQDAACIEKELAQFKPNSISKQDERLKNKYYTGTPDDFLPDLISEARKLKSSDIHIEIFEDSCRVRIRMDGQLVLRYVLDKKQYPALINKIKISAGLDIAEKRLPQDGRIFYKGKDEKIDIRVSIIATLFGEKVVLRLLNNDAANIELQRLGFSSLDLSHFMEAVKKPNGIILISGPTGSGKTTTLYATLKLLNKPTRNILTIEDPIEYTLSGINQVQVKENIGLTFATALRTFLRQDPDIIMLGEIRDSETANMAIRAALTGHLVLSTIHTNSAWGTISRLLDLNIPSFLIASTLNTSMAQRLVRCLCPHCKKKEKMNHSLFPPGYHPLRQLNYHYVPQGCPECYYTGYKGRKAIYEVVPVDRQIASLIRSEASEIDNTLNEKGIKTLAKNAFDLLEAGITSIEEIYSLLSA